MMIESIKRIALETVQASQPVNVVLGTIRSVSPLVVLIDNRIELEREFILLTETISQKGLSVNDSVVLIRFQGGQQFLLIDRVV